MSLRDGLSGRGGPARQGQAGARGWQHADEKIAKKKHVGKRSKHNRSRKQRRFAQQT